MLARSPAPSVEFPSCPLCGRLDYVPLLRGARDRLTRKEGKFDVARCRGCGLVATWPRPAPESLGDYYRGVYDSVAARFVQAGPPARAAARYRVDALLASVGPVGRDHRVLDVGCSYGTFLAELRARTGWGCTGIDLDAASIRGAHDPEHIRYLQGTLADTEGLPEGSFDIVTLFESLEHHADPVAALASAHRLLKPGGWCVVEVPNFDGAWRHVFRTWWLPLLVPQHLYHFTPRTLRETLRRAGFEPGARRAMFYPTESTISLGLWLNAVLGRPLRAFRPRWRRPDGWLLVLLLVLWWVLVEVPTQALLVAIGLSGHQWMEARKPER